jgi:hypothetical protein
MSIINLIPAPYRLAAMAGVAILAMGGAFTAGWSWRDARCDSAAATAREQATAAILRAAQHQNEVAADYEATRAETGQSATATQTIIREVYRNVPTPAEPCFPDPVADSLRAQREALNGRATSEPSPAVPANP